MKSKIIPLGFLWLIAWPLLARDKSDVLVMRNGDRLTCEVKSLDADTLSISLDYAAVPSLSTGARWITSKASSFSL